jgi:hypothetical protein
MATINQLSATDTLAGGDTLPVYKQSQGDARKASLTLLVSYLQSALSLPGTLATQYAAPSATDFTVTIAAGNTWLLLTPTGTFADGAIVLPSAPADKADVSVNCTQAVTAFVVSAGGATVTGSPTALPANGFFTMRYDAATSAWYRVG